ncbi:TPA: hypothetical protein HA371_05965 [Candidatus Woesearchaeota archaeon]|nr:hypothetical protein [Candidatus Woesearchaeota archaeon]
MKTQNEQIIDEVMDEINSSLNDSKGIVSHQRRLAFSLSLGTSVLLEDYLIKKNILKPGIKINHLWLKKSPKNIKEFLKNKLTAPVSSISDIDSILEKSNSIEKERDKLAYGKQIAEKDLTENINLFLELKKEVENA